MTIFRRGDCRDFTGDIRVHNHCDFSIAAGVVVVMEEKMVTKSAMTVQSFNSLSDQKKTYISRIQTRLELCLQQGK